MSTPSMRTRTMLIALVCSVSMLSACGSPQEPSSPRAPATQPATVRLFASAAAAPVGSRISVSLSGTTSDGAPVLGIDGWLRFSPSALRFVGRAGDSVTTVAVNDSGAARGRLRVVAVRPGRLEADAPVLAFEVVQGDYLATLEFEPRAAVGASRQLHRSSGVRRAEVRNSLSAPGAVRAAAQRGKALKLLVTPTIYGDADGSGAVAQADADLVGDWIVGNGAPPDTMTFNIANVAPQNLPGIGGSTDNDPPGWGFLFSGGGFIRQAGLTDPPISQGCDRGLAVDDLLLIAQEAGGTNVEVPGEVMPAGSQRPARCGTGSWPVLAGALPEFDRSLLVTTTDPQGATQTYYRNAAAVLFEADVPDEEKEAVVARHNLTVVGTTDASRRSVFVTFPDPGATMAQLSAFLQSLRDEPAVVGAHPMFAGAVPEIADGKLPSDGSGQARSDWMAGAQSTWALRAIRAPLAWGCENGQHGGELNHVAFIEWAFDSLHSEYASSIARNWVYGTPIVGRPVMPIDTINQRVDHSTAVVGIAAAIGDNAQGTAGLMWRNRVNLYAMYSAERKQVVLDEGFHLIAREILNDAPRVLSLSADQPIPGANQAEREAAIERNAFEFRRLLDTLPGLLIVVASGNEKVNESLAVYRTRTTPGVGLMRTTLLTLRANPTYADRIIVVTGTEPGNQFASVFPNSSLGANFFTDLTDVAAPAVDVATLRRRTGSSIPVSLQFGTSLAAPMVAGVAGQLLAMDPTLTPAQLKRYIVEGAQQPKPNAATGAATPAQPVQGAPQTIYQLDAYSSLTLLARERETTPICGFPVTMQSIGFDQVTGLHSAAVLLQRPGFQPREVYRGPVTNVTVAQGGRLIGLEELFSSTVKQSRDLAYTGGMSWTAGAPVGYTGDRQFLERDTAYTIPTTVTTPTEIQIRGPGRSESYRNVCVGLGMFIPSSVRNCLPSTISPAGEWVAVEVEGSNFDQTGCGPGLAGQAAYLVRLAGGPQVRMIREVQYDPCAWQVNGTHVFPVRDVFAWRPDGAFAWIGSSNESLVSSPNPDTTSAVPLITRLSTETRYVAEAVVSGVSTPSAYTQADWVAHAMAGQADGAHLIVYEDNAGVGGPHQCRRVRRAFGAPSQATVDGPITCFQLMEPLPVNLRARQVASRSVSAPVSRGATLMAPFVQWMERGQGRRAPRVVIAN